MSFSRILLLEARFQKHTTREGAQHASTLQLRYNNPIDQLTTQTSLLLKKEKKNLVDISNNSTNN
jgi:hypothetical protein